MTKFLKVQSQAMATVISSIIAMGILFGWWTMTPEQIAGVLGAYSAVMLALRQMFSITDESDVT